MLRELRKFLIIVPMLFLITTCTDPPRPVPVPPDIPVPAPNISSEPSIPAWQSLTLREKIAQMIMVRIRGDFYNAESWYRSELQHWIQEDGIGGVITFGGSVHGTYYNIKTFQDWAEHPLLVAADYERGTGQWLSGGTLFPTNMAVAATMSPDNAYEQGRVTAIEGRVLGVHITLSPVLDINNNPANPIINFRSYGDAPELVSVFGSAFINGVQDYGMAACAKHYPGHGNTATDSHSGLPVISGDKTDLEDMELKPFRQAVETGVKMVMVGHLAMPGLDPSGEPATHSYPITTGILRDNWNFDGIIITDGMEMTGLTQSAWAGESAIRSIAAGADILLLPMSVQQTVDAVETAVHNGRLAESRIDSSVARIWRMKTEMGLFYERQPTWSTVEGKVGIPDHLEVADQVARESITVVKDSGFLPLKPERISHLGHLILSTDEGVRSQLKPFSQDISRTHGKVTEIYVEEPLSKAREQEVIDRLQDIPMLVVTLMVRIRMDKGMATIDETHARLIEHLKDAGHDFIVISFGSPYLPDYESLPTYICAFGYGSVSQRAAAAAIWGRIDVTGHLPVDLNSLFRREDTGIQIQRRTSMFEPPDQDVNLDDVWSVLDSAISARVFPGAQVFVAMGGQEIVNTGRGRLTYDPQDSMVDAETIYDVASLTKVLATTPVTMKLLGKKLIGLDHSVNQYYPEFSGNMREDITLRHLLTHSSGLPAHLPLWENTDLRDAEDVIHYILTQDLNFQPGSQFEYSDLGIILLGSILEKVAGRSLDSMTRQYVFDALEMSRTGYNPPKELLKEVAPTELDSSYRNRLLQGEVHDENAYLLGGIAPHAGVFSTAGEIGRFAQVMLNRGTYLGSRVFSSWQIQRFTRRQDIPPGSDRALGWDTPSRNGHSSAGDLFSNGSFGHLGFTGTSLWIDPKREIIVVLLTNRVHPTRNNTGMYQLRRRFHTEVMKSLLASNAT